MAHHCDQQRRAFATFILALVLALLWAQPLPGGPRLPALLLTVAGALVWWRLGEQALTRAGQRLALLFGGLALAVIFSLLGQPLSGSGWGYAAMLIGYALAGVGAAWAVATRLGGVKLLTAGAAFFWAFLIADSLGQWLFGRDLLGVPYVSDHFEGRLVGPFAESLKMPVLVAILFPFAAWPWRNRPLVVLLLLAAAAWVVLLSGARSSLVLLFLAALPFLARLSWHWWGAVLIATTVLASVAVTLSPALQVRAAAVRDHWQRALSCSVGPECDAARNALLSNRWELWRNALRMVERHPWFGVGAKRFEAAYPEVANPTDLFVHNRSFHSHNLYTEIAAELGGVGLTFFLAGIGALGFWFWRAPPAARTRAGPWAVALFAYLWPVQSQPVLLKVWWLPVIFFLLVGYLAALDAEVDAKIEGADDRFSGLRGKEAVEKLGQLCLDYPFAQIPVESLRRLGGECGQVVRVGPEVRERCGKRCR